MRNEVVVAYISYVIPALAWT